MRALQLLAVLTATFTACRPPAPPDTSAAAKAAIDSTNAHWAHYTGSGHADSVAQFFHPQGVMYPPNMGAVRGRDSIRAFMAVWNSMPAPPPILTIRAESVWAMGTSAVELGRWHFGWPAGATPPPGTPAADSGKYIVRWVQEGGRWLIMQDIWNSDLPVPGAPQ